MKNNYFSEQDKYNKGAEMALRIYKEISNKSPNMKNELEKDEILPIKK